MQTGTRKSEMLLKVAIALCVLFSATHLVEFIYSHVPPYRAGQCLAITSNPFLTLKIDDNDIVGGYSDVTLSMLGEEKKGPISFTELRSPIVVEAECQK